MKSLRSNYFAASAVFLCSGAMVRLEASGPLPDPEPTYGPLHGTLFLELGVTADRVEGRGNLLAPLYRASDDHSMFFLDGNWGGKGDGNENASAGLGFRHRFADPDVIVGINAFYDHADFSGFNAHQFGAGFEVLSKWIDFRANGYFPSDSVHSFGRYSNRNSSSDLTISTASRTTSRRTSQTVTIDGGEGNPDTIQTTTTTTKTTRTRTDTQRTTRRERRTFERQQGLMPGFDLELGGLIPYLDCWAETRIYAGYAYFDDPFGNDISCFTARLECRPVPAVVFDVQYKGDVRLVDGSSHWFFGARVEIPFDLGNLCRGQSPFAGITEAFTPQGACWRDADPGLSKDADKKVMLPPDLMRNRMNEEIIRNWQPILSRTGYEKVSDRTTVDVDNQSTTTSKRTRTLFRVNVQQQAD